MLLRKLSPGDPVTNLALEGLEQTAPILSDAQWYNRPGSADNVKRARLGTAGTIFRALNSDNSATAPTPVYDLVAKKLISYDSKVDVALEDRNEDPIEELAHQTRLDAVEIGYVLQEKFFEGDTGDDANEFDGLRNKVIAGNVRAEDPIPLLLGNSDANRQAQQQFLEAFLSSAATVKGGASHAYMNALLKIRLLIIGKELGYYRNQKDEFGDTIEQIGDVIIRSAGYKSDGTPLLPLTETLGDHLTTSSIFFARWGERSDLTVLSSKGVVGRHAGQSGNYYINNVNCDAALVLQNQNALVQHKGWALTETPAG